MPAALLSEPALSKVATMNRKKGELLHKVNLAAKHHPMKILTEHGPILPMPKDRKKKIPHLFGKLTEHHQLENLGSDKSSQSNSDASDAEDQSVPGMIEVEKHHASNLPVLMAALVFLQARLRCQHKEEIDNKNAEHEFGIQWQHVFKESKNKGEWDEKGDMWKVGWKPSKGLSLSDAFGPRVYTANEEQQAKIRREHSKWTLNQGTGESATAMRAPHNACAGEIHKCSMDLATFIRKLLCDPEENNLVLQAMSDCDLHFKDLRPDHVLVGMKGHLMATGYVRKIMKGDDVSRQVLGIRDEDEPAASSKKRRGKKKKRKIEKHLLSHTPEEQALCNQVVETCRQHVWEKMSDDSEDMALTFQDKQWCQKMGFAALALAQSEKMVRNLGRAVALTSEKAFHFDDAQEALKNAAEADDAAVLSGTGAACDLGFHLMGTGWSAVRTVLKEELKSNVPIGCETATNTTKTNLVNVHQWEHWKPSIEEFTETEQAILRGAVLHKERIEEEEEEEDEEEDLDEE